MRLDHIAFRVNSKDGAKNLLSKLLGYTIKQPFEIFFEDGSKVECFALKPPEDISKKLKHKLFPVVGYATAHYHMAPEIFVSEGGTNSIAKNWVEEHNGMGGIHHLAYESDDIEWDIKRWKKHGIEFSTDDIIECPDDDLRQIFTKPLPALGNIILELIQRGDKGFCGDSVKRIMESTKT